MAYTGEKLREYQNARRLAIRPCQLCGEVGGATEVYQATEKAAVVRVCKPCLDKITGGAAPQPAPADTTRKGLAPGKKSGPTSRRTAAMCEANSDCDAPAAAVENAEHTDKKGQRRIMQWFYCYNHAPKYLRRKIYCEYAGGHDPAVEAMFLLDGRGYCQDCYQKHFHHRRPPIYCEVYCEQDPPGVAEFLVDSGAGQVAKCRQCYSRTHAAIALRDAGVEVIRNV